MGSQEVSVQLAKSSRRIVYRHEHTRDVEDIIWAVGSEVERNRKQLVGIYSVGEDSG